MWGHSDICHWPQATKITINEFNLGFKSVKWFKLLRFHVWNLKRSTLKTSHPVIPFQRTWIWLDHLALFEGKEAVTTLWVQCFEEEKRLKIHTGTATVQWHSSGTNHKHWPFTNCLHSWQGNLVGWPWMCQTVCLITNQVYFSLSLQTILWVLS